MLYIVDGFSLEKFKSKCPVLKFDDQLILVSLFLRYLNCASLSLSAVIKPRGGRKNETLGRSEQKIRGSCSGTIAKCSLRTIDVDAILNVHHLIF